MRQSSMWNVPLGHWAGLSIQLHYSLLLAALAIVYVCRQVQPERWGQLSLLALGALAVALVVHELGHVITAWNLGTPPRAITLTPLGDVGAPPLAHEPQRDLLAALSGPLANVVWLLLVSPALIVAGEDLRDLMLYPLSPRGLLSGTPGVQFFKFTFWMNWLVLLANALPVFPTDGGRALRAVLWPTMGYRPALELVARITRLAAVGLCLLAWILEDNTAPRVVPAWAPLLTLALVLVFSARAELHRGDEPVAIDESVGYDFSQGYTSLERAHHDDAPADGANPLRRWWRQRQEQRQLQLEETAAVEELMADEILARLSQVGMQALTTEERALLDRVSARYRARMSS